MPPDPSDSPAEVQIEFSVNKIHISFTYSSYLHYFPPHSIKCVFFCKHLFSLNILQTNLMRLKTPSTIQNYAALTAFLKHQQIPQLHQQIRLTATWTSCWIHTAPNLKLLPALQYWGWMSDYIHLDTISSRNVKLFIRYINAFLFGCVSMLYLVELNYYRLCVLLRRGGAAHGCFPYIYICTVTIKTYIDLDEK